MSNTIERLANALSELDATTEATVNEIHTLRAENATLKRQIQAMRAALEQVKVIWLRQKWCSIEGCCDIGNAYAAIDAAIGGQGEAARSCPRCKNSEMEPEHRFCKICGLPLGEKK